MNAIHLLQLAGPLRKRERGEMRLFYLISLPLRVGMVIFMLKYFAGPEVPRYVLFTVGYTRFCSLFVIILVLADIWAVRSLVPSIVISPIAACGNSF
ncbi:hypothetical protein FH972_008444 [Carpinus fangiana]|uniref:Uncharacterized protein n=1 Tax=Carpinus fangiana TaxID=176857 RepID=A0A5N6R1S1_9ROSI|nr:hypothetical protein FH972_008444 [Carpinus fangiana]